MCLVTAKVGYFDTSPDEGEVPLLLKFTLYGAVGGGGSPPLDLTRDRLRISAFKAICASKYRLRAIQVCFTV
jgi:hypothetical protein